MKKNLFTKSIVSLVMVSMIGLLTIPAFAGQGPNQAYTAINTSGYAAPQLLDANNSVLVNNNGTKSSLNITAATVVQTVAAGAQRIIRFVVTVAGSAGGIYDASTTGGATASSLIAVTPATVGIYELNWPVASGIVVSPGASQVISVSYQ